MKLKILHLAPHLGGGAGNAIKTFVLADSQSNNHLITSLDVNKTHIDKKLNVLDDMYNNISQLMCLIEESDIVILHWWNHPMTFDLLLNCKLPECRLVMWSLASCLYPPYVHSEKLLKFSDRFVFTSPVSYDSKEIKKLPIEQKEKLDMIWASGNFNIFDNIDKKEHSNFIVGTIIGSADYSKLSRDFIKICTLTKNPNIKFVIICSEIFANQLLDDIDSEGVGDKVTLYTNVSDITFYLSMFDVFSYPLQPYHFGTCEIALGEAMRCSIVPVVFNNPTESYIVDHGVNGFVANTIDEYINYIEYLYNNPKIRFEMSQAAFQSAKELYSIEIELSKWHEQFKYLMSISKTFRNWEGVSDDFVIFTGSVLFAESLGDYGNIFYDDMDKTTSNTLKKIKILFDSNPQWYSDNKGGIKQYLRQFPEDVFLQRWSKLVEVKND